MGTMTDTTKWVRMYQSPKLEFVVNQDIWFNSETRMADVILPACTNFERDDLGEFAACNGYTTNSHSGNNYRVIVREKKCIEPLWESKSDYQILADLSERLGIYDEFTDGGKTEIDWAKAFYDCSDLAKTLDWETFDKKGYHIINAPEDYKPKPCLRWFAEGRACDTPDTSNPKRGTDKAHELGTYSGKIEFSSESLKAHFPDDPERPVSPGTSRAGRATTRPSSSRSTRCSSCRRTRASRSTATTTSTPTGSTTSRSTASRRTATRGGRRASIRSTRTRAASATATSCASTTTARPCSAARSSPSGSGRASIHSYASSAKYDPLEPGKADSVDKGGCVNMLTLVAHDRAGTLPA